MLGLAVVVAAGLLIPPPEKADSAGRRPNIVVLMTDDQRTDQLAVMRVVKRRIRARGVEFARSFVSYPLCCPSRTTFLTGQFSHNHGVLGNGTPQGGFADLDQDDTLGVWLRRAGYRTIHIGKFLNGYGESDPAYVPPGWDRWISSLEPSMSRYYDYDINDNGTVVHYGLEPAAYKTDVNTRTAVREIEMARSSQPFFMYVGFAAPHIPSQPAPRHSQLLRRARLPRTAAFNERDVSDKPGFIRSLSLPRADRQLIQKRYRRQLLSLLSVDEGIRRILNALREAGILRNTYVIFTSDNGFFRGEHRIIKGKYLPYEPSLRVPLLIRGPGLPAGVRSREMVSNVDLAPTIMRLAGADATVPPDGRSLLPFARRPARRSRRPILVEALSRDEPSPGIPYAGLRTKRFKYVRYRNGEEELYDLRRDPLELHSRHRDPRYARTKRFLRSAVGRYRDCSGRACGAPLAPVPGPR